MFLSLFLAHLVAEVILFIYLFLFECRCVIVRRLLFLFKFGCDEDIWSVVEERDNWREEGLEAVVERVEVVERSDNDGFWNGFVKKQVAF